MLGKVVPTLENLALKNEKLDGATFNKLPKDLKGLYISQCSEINAKHLSKLLQLPKLECSVMEFNPSGSNYIRAGSGDSDEQATTTTKTPEEERLGFEYETCFIEHSDDPEYVVRKELMLQYVLDLDETKMSQVAEIMQKFRW